MQEFQAPPDNGVPPMSPGTKGNVIPAAEIAGQPPPMVENTDLGHPVAGSDPVDEPVAEP